MEVVVIRSPKRRKTAQARLVDGRLEVRIPGRATKAEERRLVEVFRRRFERAAASEEVDLAARARALARRHDLPEPAEIRWVANQQHRWGSCTPSTGTVRLSDRMAGFPLWVIDHVIVHELAHLVEPRHGPAFQALADRYPLAERAEGYLLAKAEGVGASDGAAPAPGDFPTSSDEPADDRPDGSVGSALDDDEEPVPVGDRAAPSPVDRPHRPSRPDRATRSDRPTLF